MVFTSVLRTLTLITIMFLLTACAATPISQGDSANLPFVEDLTDTFVEAGHILEERFVRPEDSDMPAMLAIPAVEESNLIDQQLFIDLYERVNPSVVNIQVTFTPDEAGEFETFQPFLPQIPGFPPIDPEGMPPVTPLPQQSQGSGFVYDEQGHIITNNHVVDNADGITITFADGTALPASLVGSDPDSDLAVIKVEAEPGLLHPVELGDADLLKVGQFVVAIGNPFGLEGSMTTGIISGLGRLLPAGARQGFSIPDIIQTDAAINPGNSGGPLLDLTGAVIGVNTAIQSSNRVFGGIGYAVPVNTVAEVVPELIESGRIDHPWLGISGATLTRELAEAMDLDPNQRGVLIAEVIVDGPASESQLKGSATQSTVNGRPVRVGGDLIVGIEDQKIADIDDLLSYIIHNTEVGQTVTLQIIRDKKPMNVEVTLASRPD